MVILGRVLNGIGLGVVRPLLFSLVADKNRPSKRGLAMGMLYFSAALGSAIIPPVVTAFSEATMLGLAGWRFFSLLIGVLSCIMGLVVLFLVTEPNTFHVANSGKSVWAGIIENMPKVFQLFKS